MGDFIFVSAKYMSSNVKYMPDFETYYKEVLGEDRTTLLNKELFKRLNKCKQKKQENNCRKNDYFTYFLHIGKKDNLVTL